MTPVEIIEKYNESTPLGPVLLSREEWQTLKAAVFAQQSTNSAMDEIAFLESLLKVIQPNSGISLELFIRDHIAQLRQ